MSNSMKQNYHVSFFPIVEANNHFFLVAFIDFAVEDRTQTSCRKTKKRVFLICFWTDPYLGMEIVNAINGTYVSLCLEELTVVC